MTQHSGTATPTIVKTHATQEVRLDRVALLGTFGSATRRGALVLLPHGRTRSVSIGDAVAGGTVAAIDADRLVLARRGGTQVLRMPQG